MAAGDTTLTVASLADVAQQPIFGVWIDSERMDVVDGPPASTTWSLIRETTAATLIGSDPFDDRELTQRWGAAQIKGGNWNRAGSVTSVAGGMGLISLAAGTNENPRLDEAVAPDVRVRFRFQTDKLAVADQLFVYPVARSTSLSISPETFYRAQVKINTDQSIDLRTEKVVADAATTLVADVSTGLTHAVATPIWVALEVYGFSPTTIRAHTWADGADEPATWPVSGTDSEATLQVTGRVGVRARTGGSISNAPVQFAIDNFEAYELPVGVSHSSGATVKVIEKDWLAGEIRADHGAPTAYGEQNAMYVDLDNNRLYVMVAGTWRYAALT